MNCLIHYIFFSIAILPKGLRVGTDVSTKLLYIENANELIKRLNNIHKSLATIDELSPDDLSEKTNTVRRILENLLKIYSSYLRITYPKPYSKLMLGDLMQAVKGHLAVGEQKGIEKLIESLNRGSHDSGKPLSKQEILDYNDSVTHLVYRLLKDANSFAKYE